MNARSAWRRDAVEFCDCGGVRGIAKFRLGSGDGFLEALGAAGSKSLRSFAAGRSLFPAAVASTSGGPFRVLRVRNGGENAVLDFQISFFDVFLFVLEEVLKVFGVLGDGARKVVEFVGNHLGVRETQYGVADGLRQRFAKDKIRVRR